MTAASAAVPSGDGQGQSLVTTAELNVTNASFANATIPAKFQATPTLLQVGVSTNDSSLDGPKGEMAAVPRTIGFSASPEMLAIVIIGIAAIGLGAWYSLKRKQNEDKKE
jgi:LPXTG-motif cell wall-anchored protein